MGIDTSSFLLMTGALAAGAAGGYYAHQQGWIGKSASEPKEAVVTTTVEKSDAGSSAAESAASAHAMASAAPAPPAPMCDDSQGSVGDCPPPGMPTEEGGCGTFVSTRCQDFKASMKPRVAEAAVQCLRDLKPNERCDKNRINLCGHLALTNACQEPDVLAVTTQNPAGGALGAPVTGAVPANPPQPGAVTTTAAVGGQNARADSAAALCDSIVRTAGPSRIAPTLADCKQTLSGMNDIGRMRMVECMKKNWNTKGLLGCEAVDPSKPGG